MYSFEDAERFTIKPNKIMFSVKNPVECYDFNHLINNVVMICGRTWVVKGVDRFAHAAPWWQGELIGLWVELVN